MSVPKLYKIPHETDTFNFPDPGSNHLVQYITSLTLENGENLFTKGCHNIPWADVHKILPLVKPTDFPSPVDTVNHVRQMLVFNLLANRICENCGDKRDTRKLSLCNDCALAWYCSKQCQENHWNIHKLRCCNPQGPLNEGYQSIAILKQKE